MYMKEYDYLVVGAGLFAAVFVLGLCEPFRNI